MAEINHSAWVDAKDYLFPCESLFEPKALDALDTIWNAADAAGSVTVEIRTVSRANRRGDTRTKFASDIRYARAMYTVAEWAMPILVARLRELEAQAAVLPTPAPADAAGIVVTKDELRALTHSPGVGFGEGGIEADGWQFASWERGFSDAIRVVNQRIVALTAARAQEGGE